MLKRILVGVAVAAVQIPHGPSAVADEVPIWSAYGTLASCILWMNGVVRHTAGYDGDYAMLTRSSLEGLEWGCSFGAVTATGQSSWRVKAMCEGIGEHEDGSPVPTSVMTIEELPDHTSVTIANPDFFRAPFSLPSCNLRYDQQLRVEMDRLTDEWRDLPPSMEEIPRGRPVPNLIRRSAP